MNNYQRLKGISLIEILVVIMIFAVLGILVTQSIILTLMGSKKSESIVHARENLDYSLNVIERQIRNATLVSPCPNNDYTIISYQDQNGVGSSFSCVTGSISDSYIASGSARLTSSTVRVISCSFTCTPATGANPAMVQVELTMRDALATGVQGANVSASTQIYLRNY